MKKIFLIALAFATAFSMDAASGKKAGSKEMALQLYSIRTLIGKPELYAQNHEKVFKQLKEFGYTAVEAASYNDGKFYGVSPEQYKKDVEAAGLVSMSSHTMHRLSSEELKNHDLKAALEWWKTAIQAHKKAGLKYIVTPSENFPANLEEAQTLCDYHNEIGKLCAAEGIKYGYHSHSFEFKKIGDTDQMWYDYFVQHTDPKYVFFQLDVYWCMMAQQSPCEYFKKYPGRFTCLHIKDKYELGESGMVGFDAIFKAYKTSGMKNFVVELERTDGTIDIMEGVKRSAEYLLSNDFVKSSY